MLPKRIQNIIESFKMLPGIGEKTAERLAFSFIEFSEDKLDFFVQSLQNIKNNIKKCHICNCVTDQNLCYICNDKSSRNNEILCVVDDSKILFNMEKNKIFNGLYYVLDNLISPIDGITPDDIGLNKLLKYIDDNNFNEIIIVLKPSIEGEMTGLYIKRILSDKNIKITKIANGIPLGVDLEYIDSMTLERAILDRKSIE